MHISYTKIKEKSDRVGQKKWGKKIESTKKAFQKDRLELEELIRKQRESFQNKEHIRTLYSLNRSEEASNSFDVIFDQINNSNFTNEAPAAEIDRDSIEKQHTSEVKLRELSIVTEVTTKEPESQTVVTASEIPEASSDNVKEKTLSEVVTASDVDQTEKKQEVPIELEKSKDEHIELSPVITKEPESQTVVTASENPEASSENVKEKNLSEVVTASDVDQTEKKQEVPSEEKQPEGLSEVPVDNPDLPESDKLQIESILDVEIDDLSLEQFDDLQKSIHEQSVEHMQELSHFFETLKNSFGDVNKGSCSKDDDNQQLPSSMPASLETHDLTTTHFRGDHQLRNRPRKTYSPTIRKRKSDPKC